MPGVVSNPSPLPSAFTIHSDAEYEVTVGRKTSRSGSNDRGIIFRRKASSSILTIRERFLERCRRGLLPAALVWVEPVDGKACARRRTLLRTTPESARLSSMGRCYVPL